MIRSRTGGDGSLDFFDDEAPGTVVGAVTKDGITGAEPGDITSDDITDAGDFGKTMLKTGSNGDGLLALGIPVDVQAVVTADDVDDARTALGAGTSNLALGTTSATAAAGDHTHAGLTADQVAANGSVRTLGTGAQQAAPGNHSHAGLTADQVAGTASVRTLGTGAQQAAAGNHTHTVSQVTDLTAVKLMTGTSLPAINNQSGDFADLTAVTTAYNALLAALRTRGVIGGS